MEARANSKSSIWLAVINGDKERASLESEATCRLFLEFQGLLINCSTFKYLFSIVHDKDPQKRPHLHAFIELYEKATKKTVLDTLTELLKIDPNQISLEPSNSQYLGVQYLTHKNDKTKEPYSIDAVISNNNEEFLKRWAMEYVDPQKATTEALYGSKTMAELIEKLGLDDTKKYLSIYRAIQEEKGYNKAGLLDQLQKMRQDYCYLYDLTLRLFDTLEVDVYKDNKKDFLELYGRLKELFDELLPF